MEVILNLLSDPRYAAILGLAAPIILFVLRRRGVSLPLIEALLEWLAHKPPSLPNIPPTPPVSPPPNADGPLLGIGRGEVRRWIRDALDEMLNRKPAKEESPVASKDKD